LLVLTFILLVLTIILLILIFILLVLKFIWLILTCVRQINFLLLWALVRTRKQWNSWCHLFLNWLFFLKLALRPNLKNLNCVTDLQKTGSNWAQAQFFLILPLNKVRTFVLWISGSSIYLNSLQWSPIRVNLIPKFSGKIIPGSLQG